jgi:hypothetical protein
VSHAERIVQPHNAGFFLIPWAPTTAATAIELRLIMGLGVSSRLNDFPQL